MQDTAEACNLSVYSVGASFLTLI